MTVDPNELREMGRIVAAHGVIGEMKVAPETDDPNRFLQLKSLLIGKDERSLSDFDILTVRTMSSKHGITVILGLRGIADRQQAENMRKMRIFAKRVDLPPLASDEYYLDELVGLQAVSEDGTPLGTIKDVLELPAHNVLVVATTDGREMMIPSVPEFVKEIDFEACVVRISLIEGMF